ncbi:MAG TPA: XRE family transcriptional regulator [Blastocatellia bacterium]|nr:XRE family transcriptional regulator [Blastocatellia bacterium]
MSKKLEGVQGSVLRWARESQGYSLADVATRLKRDPNEIAAWESGESTPTYVQLETLAYSIYKRPLAVFFWPEPPLEPTPEREFRTLPDFDLDNLRADTRYQIRLAHAFQLSLNELTDGKNQAEHLIFRDSQLTPNGNIREPAARVREYLGVPLEVQTEWRNSEVALKHWRDAVEDKGVFVFKHAFKQKEISGFCLFDSEFPIIYLSNSTTKTRQVFSLFHELAHLLLHINGISKFDPSYITELPPRERRMEQFSNMFAAELLIPSDDFDVQIQRVVRLDERSIQSLANRYSVSREAVLRRVLDKGLVTKSDYEEKAAEWAAQVEEEGSGGNYYATQATYLGNRYLRLVFGKYYQGKLSLEQVAEYLGVKTKSVAGLEELAVR